MASVMNPVVRFFTRRTLVLLIGGMVIGGGLLVFMVNRVSEEPDFIQARLERVRTDEEDYITGVVVSRSGRAYRRVVISFALLDDDWNRVGVTGDTVDTLGPGQMWRFRAPVEAEGVVRFAGMGVDGW